MRLEPPREAIGAICRKHPVRELSVFGSVPRDDFGPDSDVDFLVVFKPGARVSPIELIGMQHELQDLLGRRVDLVSKGGSSP